MVFRNKHICINLVVVYLHLIALKKYNTKIEGCVRPPSRLLPKEHTGLPKGIQGHQNSCYIDATLYGMFAFSDAFDGLFLTKEINRTNQQLQETIQQNIVNPLRV